LNVDKNFLSSLSKQINSVRPKIRLSDDIDLNATKVLLMNDLTSISRQQQQQQQQQHSQLLTIELKPKCGVLPTSKYISIENQPFKSKTCRYCMHQILKLMEGKATSQSDYCPLDLFSGDSNRIRKALHSLFSQPQNNLKLFLDGQLLFTGLLGGGVEDENRNVNSFLISKLPDFAKVINDNNDSFVSSLIQILCDILQREPLLYELKKLHSLDSLDIEAIEFLKRKYFDENYCFRKGDERFKELELEIEKQTNEQQKLQYAQALIDNYLLSMTSKDCSILISLFLGEEKQPLPQQFKRISKEFISYRIVMIDLDPKSFDNIQHYFELDSEIVETFKKSKKYQRKCIA